MSVTMCAGSTRTTRFEATVSRDCPLPGRQSAVALRLTVALATPGECCVNIATSLAFAYDPPLPDDLAVRLDDRLYDGLYDGLAAAEGPFPPENLKVEVPALAAEPPLAGLLAGDDAFAVAARLGDCLAGMAREAVLQLWPRVAGPLVTEPAGEPG